MCVAPGIIKPGKMCSSICSLTMNISQLQMNVYVWLGHQLSWKNREGWRIHHGSTRWDQRPASCICFTLLFPASNVKVTHIMGSRTALRWDRKLIQIGCIEGNDIITWQFISCGNLPESNSQEATQKICLTRELNYPTRCVTTPATTYGQTVNLNSFCWSIWNQKQVLREDTDCNRIAKRFLVL